MALVRRKPKDATRVASSWRDLIHPQPEALMQRARLQLWQYDHRKGSVLLLRPKRIGSLPVLALCLETTVHHDTSALQKAIDKGVMPPPDSLPKTRCLVRWRKPATEAEMQDATWFEEECMIENGHAIRHVSPTTFDAPAFYAIRVPEELWNHTRELPEAPGIVQPMPPMKVDALRVALEESGIDPHEPKVQLVSPEVAVVEQKRKGKKGFQRAWDF